MVYFAARMGRYWRGRGDMSEKSTIQWTDATWSPVTGCSKVSPGCDNCYAIKESNRHRNLPKYAGLVQNGDWTGEVRCHPDLACEPLKWKKPKRIFVCSMSDLFHSNVPWEFIIKVFDVMRECPQHTFQLLTKRPGRMAHFAEYVWPLPWPDNVWAGTSVESQKYAPRIDCLLRVPAKVRFISAEPLLEPLNIKPYFFKCTGCGQIPCDCEGVAIQQVIIGGESGPGARPMSLNWARDIVEQCDTSGVAAFVKQMGSAPMSDLDDQALWERLIDLALSSDGVKLSDNLGNTFRRGVGGIRLGHYLKFHDLKGGIMDEWPESLRRREFPCTTNILTKKKAMA